MGLCVRHHFVKRISTALRSSKGCPVRVVHLFQVQASAGEHI